MMRGLEIYLLHCHPAEAELTFTWLPDEPDSPGWELRGRLVGPQHAFRETIQIPYPLRPQPRTGDTVRARVVIPDPLTWSPADPFLYRGVVEIWRHDTMLSQADVVAGLCTVALHPRKGLRVNGSPLDLQCLLVREMRRDQIEIWRQAGINALCLPLTSDHPQVWTLAQQFGFFVLAEVDPENEDLLWQAAEVPSQHTSCLGWILPQDLSRQPQRWHQVASLLQPQRPGVFLGLRVMTLPLDVVPGHVAFLTGDLEILNQLPAAGLPQLPLLPRGQRQPSTPPPANTLRLGCIYRRLEGI
jgi:hypothetical protein